MSDKFYVTTSIAYTNAAPHLGFSLEAVQADVIARYNRLAGKEVFFLTGTDEHGVKIVKAAKEAGKEPKEFVEEISAKFQELKNILNLSNDDFIRTSDRKRHWPAVEKVWLQLKEKGDVYKKRYKGLYCSGCEAFITKKDLKDGKCIIHRREPEVVEEENYFFRLSKYSKEIERIISKDKIKIIPRSRKNEILSFIEQGLEDISFSRPRKDLKWAVPVPDDSGASVYVWADALINYISALGYAENGKKFKEFWPANVHCIGKDILKFHGAIWPGMLLSLGLPLPKAILVHGFVTVNGQKISKSLGNIIDPFQLVEKYGTDPVRYYLLREISSTEDGDFTYRKFEERYNADLAKGLGNLVARVITVASELGISESTPLESSGGFGNSVEENTNFLTGSTPLETRAGHETQPHELSIFLPNRSKLRGMFLMGSRVNSELKAQTKKTQKDCKKSLGDFKFNEALAAVWELIGFCDRYIEKERPWEKSKKQPAVIYNLLVALADIASLLQPFLPETAEKIFGQLGVKPEDKKRKFLIKKGEPLFPRI